MPTTVTDEVYRARVVKGWVFANHTELERAAIRHFLRTGEVADGFPYTALHASGACWGESDPRNVRNRGRQAAVESPQPAVARVVVRRSKRNRSDGLNYEVLMAAPGASLLLIGRMSAGGDAYEYGLRVMGRLEGRGRTVVFTAAI